MILFIYAIVYDDGAHYWVDLAKMVIVSLQLPIPITAKVLKSYVNFLLRKIIITDFIIRTKIFYIARCSIMGFFLSLFSER